MTPPSQLWRVEWRIARDFYSPHDRVERSRNFQSAHRAAEQVRAVQMWVPTHAELLGVFHTTGGNGPDVAWEEIDPESGLPPLMEHVAERYDLIQSAIPEEQT